MASNPIGMASNLEAMASNPVSMASNLNYYFGNKKLLVTTASLPVTSALLTSNKVRY